jgi:hypothetical protein
MSEKTIYIPDHGALPADKALELMTDRWADNGSYCAQTVLDLRDYALTVRADLADQSALLEELRKAGNELVQSRLHQDVCIAEYRTYGGPVHKQAAIDSTCRVADAIKAWELLLTKLPNPTNEPQPEKTI